MLINKIHFVIKAVGKIKSLNLCDTETKHQVESSPEFNKLEETLDYMGLLALIKKLVYTGGANNKNLQHNKAMEIMKLMTLSRKISGNPRVYRPISGNTKSMQRTEHQIWPMQGLCKGNVYQRKVSLNQQLPS